MAVPRGFYWGFALLSLSACAGGRVKPIEPAAALPQELPHELQRKFEVQEAQPPGSAADSPKAAPRVAKRGPRSKKAAFSDPEEYRSPESPRGQPVAAQPSYPNRRPVHDPIWPGERLSFSVTYLGMAAGDADLEVLPYKFLGGRKVYHVRALARSGRIFSLFYRLEDTLESFFDFEGLFSHRFHLNLDESKQTRDALELNDSEKGQSFYWNRLNHESKGSVETRDFFPMVPLSQDSLSALYYLRTLPLRTGEQVEFPVISEGKTWNARVTVLRREVVDSPMGKVPAIVLRPETQFQGALQKKGDSSIWLTDDDRRLILRLEAQVRVGTVVATLKNVIPGTSPK